MGADLYIESISDAAREEWSPVFDKAVSERDQWMKDHEDMLTTEQKQASNRWIWAPQDGDEALIPEEYLSLLKKVNEAYNNMYPDAGYYRDSYNSSNLLWKLDISYWGDGSDYIDEEGYMQVSKIRHFKGVIEARLHLLDHISPDDEQEYFKDKARRLLDFLDKALQLEEAIYCSV